MHAPARGALRTSTTSDERSLVTAAAGDVAKASAAELVDAQGAGRASAASASPSGGSPQDVDKAGLVAVARACIAANVPRLVIVSSGSVSKPLSPVYVFLNLFGGIMRAKIEGEDAVRSLYFKRDGLDYVVVRPGGLTEDEPRGVGAIELNQGDERAVASLERTSRRYASNPRSAPTGASVTSRSSVTGRTPPRAWTPSGSPT